MAYPNPEEYIASHPVGVQEKLRKVRAIIIQNAPEAVEGMSYGIIGYKLNGKPLVYFGAGKNHIGFYATPNGHEAFSKELSKFKQGKGSVQFPIEEKLPLSLIKKIVRFRVEELKCHFFVSGIGQPAQRALTNSGITSEQKLSEYTIKEILSLHGVGKSIIPKLEAVLAAKGLKFRS